MSDVTRILGKIEAGDARAAEELLPLVYEQLRTLAAAKMAQEKPGQTLQATALVHEAYIRLVDTEKVQHWNSRAHFYVAAAEAMRRILVESARRKGSLKGGGELHRRPLHECDLAAPGSDHDILVVDEALVKLGKMEPKIAELVKLRFFGGMTIKEAAQLIDVSPRTADEYWAYAKAWLFREIENSAQ